MPHAVAHVRRNRFAPCDRLRIDVCRRMRKYSARDIRKYARLQNLYPGEHQWRTALILFGRPPRRHGGVSGRADISGVIGRGRGTEASDQSVTGGDRAEPFTRRIGPQHERRQGLSPPVCFERLTEVNISRDLSVDDDERVVFEQ